MCADVSVSLVASIKMAAMGMVPVDLTQRFPINRKFL